MKTQTLLVCVIAIGVCSACSSTTEPVCPNVPGVQKSALIVFVRDSVSNAFIGNASTATAIDGTFFDTRTTGDDPSLSSQPIYLAFNRAGKYDVYVSKAGYRGWVDYGVVVAGGACGDVTPVTVNAKLQRTAL